MTIIAVAAALWWTIAVIVLILTLAGALLQPATQRRRGRQVSQPPISVILPVKLLDPGFSRAQNSMFEQDYPDYEVIVAAAEAESPALAAMRGLAKGELRSVRFARSEATEAVSPKLNVIAGALGHATHALVLTKDSNITLPRDGLASFMAALTPDVGLVVGVPVAVRAETLAGHIEAFLINGHARLLLTASALGLGFGIGKVMLFRRADLLRAGGVAALAHTIAEDSALAKAMAGIGLKTRFAMRTVAQETGARSLREIFERQCRWSVIRRGQEPVTYVLELFISPLLAAGAAALAASLAGLPGWLGFLATLVGWLTGEVAVAALKGWGVSPWMAPAFLGREVLSLTAWVRAWVRQDVVWAAGRYDLSAEVGRKDEKGV